MMPGGLSSFQTLPPTPSFGSNSSSSDLGVKGSDQLNAASHHVKQEARVPQAPLTSQMSPSPPALISATQKSSYHHSRNSEYNSNGWCSFLNMIVMY